MEYAVFIRWTNTKGNSFDKYTMVITVRTGGINETRNKEINCNTTACGNACGVLIGVWEKRIR